MLIPQAVEKIDELDLKYLHVKPEGAWTRIMSPILTESLCKLV